MSRVRNLIKYIVSSGPAGYHGLSVPGNPYLHWCLGAQRYGLRRRQGGPLNRLTEEIILDPSNVSPNFDASAPLPPDSIYTSQHEGQDWALDMLGNWDSRRLDADHDGDLSDNQGGGYKDARSHNAANEIESGLPGACLCAA